ncbi:MAG TPA: hypothetical protein VLG14_11420 [Sphingomonas sp.]|nr:hypothetical protein [Sphingomonas sp.]
MSDQIRPFREVLQAITNSSPLAWVYLPSEEKWSLDSASAILESEEVSPDQEDDDDAGVPDFAKANGFIRALPVTSLQDVVQNALAQKPDAGPSDIFAAFEFYYERDAFIRFD